MKDDVRVCVGAKINFFEEYFEITDAAKDEYVAFAKATEALGESSSDATEFEARYISEGLMDKFNTLIPKCKPKSHKMTKEEKKYSRQVAKELFKENKKEFVTDALMDAANTARIYGEGELIAQRREQMIEDGTMDDYTRTRNAVDAGESVVGSLFRKFKK